MVIHLSHSTLFNHIEGAKKKQISPITGPEWPRRFQEVKVLRFRDNGTGWW